MVLANSMWAADCTLASVHDELLEESVRAVRVRLESKLARGKEVFSQRFGHLRPAERELVLATIARVASPGYIEHDEPADCPACASPGWLSGETRIDEKAWAVMFAPVVFSCPACDLRLEHDKLIELDDFGEEFKIDESPEEFYPVWDLDGDLDLQQDR
ncbi:hypothetical protein [Streptomyces mirabilis]|uniref:hypothetical protein n=1 Tax=Streptomyces mirabilis TaxID=68239 RepID=UPI0033A177D9